MPNIGTPELIAILSGLLTIRAMLTAFRKQASTTAVFGLLGLVVAYYLYSLVAPEWQQVQSLLGQLSVATNPAVRQNAQSIQNLYFAAIGLMLLGGLMGVVGFLGIFIRRD